MKILRPLILLSFLLLSMSGILVLQEQSLKSRKVNELERYKNQANEDQVFLDIQQRTPTLGFSNILADWALLRFIQYFGDGAARKVTGYSLIPQFFQVIVDNDPRFSQALLLLSTANTLYALNPETTVKLLDQSLKSLTPQLSPLTPYVWTYKGVDEMLFLGDMKASEQSYRMAAKWALMRSNKESKAIAQRNQETADFLAKNPNSKKAQTMAWMSIMENAITEDIQQRAIQEIRSLGGKIKTDSQGQLVIIFPEKD